MLFVKGWTLSSYVSTVAWNKKKNQRVLCVGMQQNHIYARLQLSWKAFFFFSTILDVNTYVAHDLTNI